MIALAAHRRQTTALQIAPVPGEIVTSLASQFATLALDYLETGVFILDADSRIHFASAAAKHLLETGRLSVRNERLCSPVAAENTTLRRNVKQCIEATSAPTSMIFQRLGDVDDVLCLGLVAASQPCESLQGRFLIVFAAKPCDVSLPDSRQLRGHFGLTDAQAKLAIEIAKGQGLKACARKLGIAVSTGRSHLKQIFEKTETRRQAELVRLISGCRFNVRAPEEA